MTATDLGHALARSFEHPLSWLMQFGLWVLAARYRLREPWPADEPRFDLVGKQTRERGACPAERRLRQRAHPLFDDRSSARDMKLAARAAASASCQRDATQ